MSAYFTYLFSYRLLQLTVEESNSSDRIPLTLTLWSLFVKKSNIPPTKEGSKVKWDMSFTAMIWGGRLLKAEEKSTNRRQA